jgi:hypothetical protein
MTTQFDVIRARLRRSLFLSVPAFGLHLGRAFGEEIWAR